MRIKLRHDHPVIFSMVAFCLSIGALLYVDNRNDNDLLQAQCAANNDRNNVIVSAFFRAGEAFPNNTQAEKDFLEWIVECFPQRDCDDPLAIPERRAECDAVTAREPTSD